MITCLGLSPALDVTYGIDALTPGGIHRPVWKTALPGGKSLNVARALRVLGVPVRAIAPLGGAIGETVRTGLAAAAVEAARIDTEAETRMCVSAISDADDAITEFYEQAVPIDDVAWAAVVAALAEVAEGWLAVSGSVPDDRVGALAEALAEAAGRGVRIAVDVRGAALEAVLQRLRPALVKVNRTEASEAVGAAEPAELARRLHVRGAETAVVTDGADGSAAVDAAGSWRAEPADIGRYTVGAGDSYFAGLLAVLDAGGALPDALAHAARIAAANTLRPGAAVFSPTDAPTGIRVVPTDRSRERADA